MKKSGITWNKKHIFAYIGAPGKYVPGKEFFLTILGNRMSYAGLKDPKDRADLIAYLADPKV